MNVQPQQRDEALLEQSSKQEFRDLRFKALAQAFLELADLLEDYAPVWYTERNRNRVLAARELLQKG